MEFVMEAVRRRAYTLVELLVAILVMAIAMGLIVPAITSLLLANNLGRAGQIVADQINLTRQLASTRSATMEVRLIRLPDRPAAGYHALQVWGATDAGTNAPMGRFMRLPDGVFISGDAVKFSPLLGLVGGGGQMVSGPANQAPYVSFRIRPTGMVVTGTTVPSMSSTNSRANLCLSVIPEKNTPVIHNFVTVQINPDTGSTTIYRPE